MKPFGYVHVSSKDQNEQRQLDALAAFGVAARGLRFGRPAQPIPAWFPELYRI